MIFYPLTIPGPIYPDRADLKQFDAIAENISPFDGTGEQQQFNDQHWELDLEWPPMTWAQFAGLQAFTAALHGKIGSFLWGPPLATGPRGVGNSSGPPVVGDAAATASVSITYLDLGELFAPPNTTAILLVNVATFPAWAVPGTQGITISGVTNHPEFNGMVLPIYETGINSRGPYIILGPILNNTEAYFGEADTGTLTPPVYNGIGSNLLYTSGWTPSTTGVLLPGDFLGLISLDANGVLRQRLFQYINVLPLNTDSGGNALIDIFPSLHETAVPGTQVFLNNPRGEFRLTDNRRSAPAKSNKTFTLAMKCREAI